VSPFTCTCFSPLTASLPSPLSVWNLLGGRRQCAGMGARRRAASARRRAARPKQQSGAGEGGPEYPCREHPCPRPQWCVPLVLIRIDINLRYYSDTRTYVTSSRLTLCGAVVSVHSIRSFYPFILSVHSVRSFCPFILSVHSIRSFYPFILSVHSICSFYPFILSVHSIRRGPRWARAREVRRNCVSNASRMRLECVLTCLNSNRALKFYNQGQIVAAVAMDMV
jgi:hypothetical protein